VDADALLREILIGRAPTGEELSAIVTHIAESEFITDSSLERHLGQRVADQQWRAGTTAGEYLDDLRRVAAAALTLVVYVRRGGGIAILIGRTDVIPVTKTGTRPLPNTVVVYSVDRAKVISGYQFSALAELSIPEDATWLQLTASQ
jgi:hypothetical protein